jgi:hypothetical protein
MSWLPGSITVISQFAIRHGILVTVIVCAMTALVVGLPKFFENLPRIVESIYKRRTAILEAKKDIRAAKDEGKVNRITAITDRRATLTRLKEQTSVLRKAKVATPDDAVKLIQAINADPNLPEKRRLPNDILGEIYTDGKRDGAGTPPGSGPPGNIRRLRKTGPP